VGDPFKDTSSVAMNPIIKFTTLFGLLATEIAVAMQRGGQTGLKTGIAVALFVVALIFVYRSFYGMRIPEEKEQPKPAAPARATVPAQKELAGSKH
jgi:K(+)-stimulated pyrophosphate-energized sodium pump